jgi:alkylation response protein AidB-like acyl-CoA dehydrogenase
MWDQLSDDERAWKETCRRFATEVIEPVYRQCDQENRFPREVHEAAYAQGLMNIALPSELGGGGRSYKILAVGGEELAAVCSPTAFGMGFNHGALQPVLYAGTDAQKQRFVKDLLERRGYAALCLTEPDASGSDLMAVKTTAVRTGDGWVLNGTKAMVGNGVEAELYLVLADVEENGRRRGPTFFAVPRTDGVNVGENTDKLGFRCVTTPTVRFENVALTDEHVIGDLGQAELILLWTLDFIRFGGASVILGIVVGGLRHIVPWLEQRRVAGGVPLITKSDVQMTLGRIHAEVQVVRMLMWRAAELIDQGKSCALETAVAKYKGSELAVDATGSFVQMLGWRGIDNDYPAHKRLRDARVTTLYEGTSQIQLLNIFRELRRSVHTGGAL